MSNFAGYITAAQAKAYGDTRSLVELEALSKNAAKCSVCGAIAWRLGGSGMCFSCTTGEADASGDYELVSVETKHKKRRVLR